MVKIGITTNTEDQTVPDKITKAVGTDMARLIENALNRTNDPELAMTMLEERLSELFDEMMHEYRAGNILK